MNKITLTTIRFLIISSIAVFNVSTMSAQTIPQFTIMTEQWIPYQFVEDGKIQGLAVDCLVLMLERVGSSQNRNDINIVPWARGYIFTQKEKNTILFSTTRTKEREKMFKWVGPIFQNTMALIAKKEKNVIINSPEDLIKYEIGTVRNDVGEQYMVKLGMSLDQVQRNKSYIMNIQKLILDRIDIIVSSFAAVSNNAKSLGIDPDLFETVFIVNTDDIAYAFHKGTPDWIINKFQNALNELKAQGKFDQLQDKYKGYEQ